MYALLYIVVVLALIHFNSKAILVGLFSIIFFAVLGNHIGVIISAVFSVLFCIPLIRKYLISKPILAFIRKLDVLPKISETEQIALDAGTTWVEGEFFKAKPDIAKILNEPFEGLSPEEVKFLENEVETICELVDEYKVFEDKDLPSEVWEYLKKNRFFGMIIPKEYGGLYFSANAQSAIVSKIGSRSQVLAITTMVPNSLGPGELLIKYGTQSQKDYYLPRLADGREIPCFGLTEPFAGSDATSIKSDGILFKGEDGKLKIRLNFQKRYITLGGIATVIGLAFQLKDPDGLIPKGSKIGITCALLKGNLYGIERGKRHMPMHVPFINSPISGTDVIISVEDDVIGGVSGLGEGWRMLMECLSVGRGISLPAIASAASKYSTKVSLMYASLRRQFGMPVAKFEGIEEVLADMIAKCYSIDAMRIFTATAVSNGHKPAITNAIVKYHSTETARETVNGAMDILAGAAISTGPNNLIVNVYLGVPVAITVEGANIMTRSLLHFGQGLMRCHPFLFNEMISIQNNNLNAFDTNFWGHVGSFISKRVRMFTLKFKRLLKCFSVVKPTLENEYTIKMEIASARFGFLSDLILLMYGGSFKIKEKLSGRFGDVVSNLYIMSSILRKYKADNSKEYEEVARYALEQCMFKIDKATAEIYANLSHNGFVNGFIKVITLMVKPSFLSRPIRDKTSFKIVKNTIENKAIFENTFTNIFRPTNPEERLYQVEECFKDAPRASEIMRKIKKGKLTFDAALKNNVITKDEHDFITKWDEVAKKVVQVDDFPLIKSNAFAHNS